MDRTVDYVILGAGIAGMTIQHFLKESSNVLLDPSPGKYKIGESIIPQHFYEPEVRPLFDIVCKLPSATPKDGSLFVSDDSVGGFEPFTEANYAVHVARQELEAATAEFFGTKIVRERVESVDVEGRTVKTDQGTFKARKLIIDCSGPARIIARTLGTLREIWPAWASWAYHDVLDADDERFMSTLRRGDKKYFRFNNSIRQLEECTDFEGFRPKYTTVLSRVREGMWTWQIPLYNASRLSVGVVSRHGPVSPEEYKEIVAGSIAPQFRTQLRPWDMSGHFNSFHVRNRFAWASDRFAGESWALLGDAAFFGDPIFSVGTGLSTNHAIQLGRLLRENEWSPKLAAAHQRHTAYLYERAKRAYDSWYFGKVVQDKDVAVEIQTDFLNGRAFQVHTFSSYTEMWAVCHPQDTINEISQRNGDAVTEQLAAMLDEGAQLAGWGLVSARAFKARLELEWQRPDTAPLFLTIERLAKGQPAYRAIDGLGLSYRPPKNKTGQLDGQGMALLNAFAKVVERDPERLRTMMSEALY